MTGDPLARPEQDQQVADRHPDIPQESLIALGDLVDPCPACNADPYEDCRPWCVGQAADDEKWQTLADVARADYWARVDRGES